MPTDTRTAIHDGIYFQMIGGVEKILAELRKSLPWPSLRLVVTGGDATLLAPHIAGWDAIMEPDLVLHGLLASHEMTRSSI